MLRLTDLVKALRPRHWIKNLLVFSAPAAGDALGDGEVLVACVLILVAFSLVASAVYLINDVADAESDRHHPQKRHRPIASGAVSIPVALSTAVVLSTAGLALGWLAGAAAAGLILVYLVTAILYSLSLKLIAVVDLVIVASGFVLRAAAGATAADVPTSPYFLTVIAFAALAVAAGKRGSELHRVGESQARSRPVLERYTTSFLDQVQAVSAGGALVVYSLWAFAQGSARPEHSVWLGLSVVPLTLAMLRYLLAAAKGLGEAPEALLFEDRVLCVSAVIWAVMFSFGVMW